MKAFISEQEYTRFKSKVHFDNPLWSIQTYELDYVLARLGISTEQTVPPLPELNFNQINLLVLLLNNGISDSNDNYSLSNLALGDLFFTSQFNYDDMNYSQNMYEYDNEITKLCELKIIRKAADQIFSVSSPQPIASVANDAIAINQNGLTNGYFNFESKIDFNNNNGNEAYPNITIEEKQAGDDVTNGNKRKKPSISIETVTKPESNTGENANNRLNARRQQNKAAAQKSRDKKVLEKQENELLISMLQSRVSSLEAENASLRKQVAEFEKISNAQQNQPTLAAPGTAPHAEFFTANKNNEIKNQTVSADPRAENNRAFTNYIP